MPVPIRNLSVSISLKRKSKLCGGNRRNTARHPTLVLSGVALRHTMNTILWNGSVQPPPPMGKRCNFRLTNTPMGNYHCVSAVLVTESEYSERGPCMTFQVGEKVVYPNHGVGTIENISSR